MKHHYMDEVLLSLRNIHFSLDNLIDYNAYDDIEIYLTSFKNECNILDISLSGFGRLDIFGRYYARYKFTDIHDHLRTLFNKNDITEIENCIAIYKENVEVLAKKLAIDNNINIDAMGHLDLNTNYSMSIRRVFQSINDFSKEFE